MENEFTLTLAEARQHLLDYKTATTDAETAQKALELFDTNGEYYEPSKSFISNADGTVTVLEAIYGIHCYDINTDTFIFSETCETVAELIAESRRLLEEHPTATVYAVELKEGWTDIDADNTVEDRMVIIDNYSTEVYEVEIEDGDFFSVGLATTMDDVLILKAMADDCKMPFKAFRFNGTFDEFLFDEYWLDKLGDEIEF